MGETMPYHLWRFDNRAALIVGKRPLKEVPSFYLKRNMFVTTSGQFDNVPLIAALSALGNDRVLFSIDYPYEDTAVAGKFLDGAPLDEATRAKVAQAWAAGSHPARLSIGARGEKIAARWGWPRIVLPAHLPASRICGWAGFLQLSTPPARFKQPSAIGRRGAICMVFEGDTALLNPARIILLKIAQHFADRCPTVTTVSAHGIVYQPLSGMGAENGISQLCLKPE